jgi:hypothetical protein
MVLASIDRSIASLLPAPLEPAEKANKPRSVKNLKAENDLLKKKLQKRTREVKDLQKELQKLKDLLARESDGDDDSDEDNSDDNDPAPKRRRPANGADTDESDGE